MLPCSKYHQPLGIYVFPTRVSKPYCWCRERNTAVCDQHPDRTAARTVSKHYPNHLTMNQSSSSSVLTLRGDSSHNSIIHLSTALVSTRRSCSRARLCQSPSSWTQKTAAPATSRVRPCACVAKGDYNSAAVWIAGDVSQRVASKENMLEPRKSANVRRLLGGCKFWAAGLGRMSTN